MKNFKSINNYAVAVMILGVMMSIVATVGLPLSVFYALAPITQDEMTRALQKAAHQVLSDAYLEDLTAAVEAETTEQRNSTQSQSWVLEHLEKTTSEELLAEVITALNVQWGEDWGGIPDLYGLKRADLANFMLGKLENRAAFLEYQAWLQVIMDNPARAYYAQGESYLPDGPLPIDDNGVIGNSYGTIDDRTPISAPAMVDSPDYDPNAPKTSWAGPNL